MAFSIWSLDCCSSSQAEDGAFELVFLEDSVYGMARGASIWNVASFC